MIGDIQWKVCGLTSVADAEAALAAGADYIAFNFYPKSPRSVTHAKYLTMAQTLPASRHVAVVVEPELEEVEWLVDQHFDAVQIHFRIDLPAERLAAWSEAVSPAKLWLAPKLPPGTPLPAALLPLAQTFLLDTFAADKFGGTGKTGDWTSYQALKAAHPDKTWILSGGLSPDNISGALRATGAQFLDVNSGVESAPGIKDPVKIRAFAAAVNTAATRV